MLNFILYQNYYSLKGTELSICVKKLLFKTTYMGEQSILKFDPCILAKHTVVGGSLMSIGQRPLNFCFLLTFLKEPHDLVGAPGCNLWQTSNLWKKVNWKISTRRISVEFSILLTYPNSNLFGQERGWSELDFGAIELKTLRLSSPSDLY